MCPSISLLFVSLGRNKIVLKTSPHSPALPLSCSLGPGPARSLTSAAGSALSLAMRAVNFSGATGSVTINAQGDRDAEFTVLNVVDSKVRWRGGEWG